MKKLYTMNITWPKLIVFSIIIGVFTGLVMVPQALVDTSFQNIGICFEAWIFMAIILIMNTHSYKEAMMKTFIFFLISQPIVYLVQVPFASLGWELFGYYRRWFIWTLLTIPGSAIAYYVKKDNIGSSLVLSVATMMLAFELYGHANSCIQHMPKQILACIFIVFSIIFFSCTLLTGKKKIIPLLAAVLTCVVLFFLQLTNKPSIYTVLDSEQTWTYVEENEPVEVVIEDGYRLAITLNTKEDADYALHFISNNNVEEIVHVTYSEGKIDLYIE